MHCWFVEGEYYLMARLPKMSRAMSLSVGVEVQPPGGKRAKHDVLYFGIEQGTVMDLRSGV